MIGRVYLPDSNLFGEIVPCGFVRYERLLYTSKEVGETVCIRPSAPGIGHWKYEIRYIEGGISYGVLVEDTVRDLAVAEVR